MAERYGTQLRCHRIACSTSATAERFALLSQDTAWCPFCTLSCPPHLSASLEHTQHDGRVEYEGALLLTHSPVRLLGSRKPYDRPQAACHAALCPHQRFRLLLCLQRGARRLLLAMRNVHAYCQAPHAKRVHPDRADGRDMAAPQARSHRLQDGHGVAHQLVVLKEAHNILQVCILLRKPETAPQAYAHNRGVLILPWEPHEQTRSCRCRAMIDNASRSQTVQPFRWQATRTRPHLNTQHQHVAAAAAHAERVQDRALHLDGLCRHHCDGAPRLHATRPC